MQANSFLSLRKYVVNKMLFSINENFQLNQNEPIELHPEFSRQIRKLDSDNALINLHFQIKNDEANLPFSIEVNIEGLFHLENWEKPGTISLMTTNSIAILFPYLRSIVSVITANANIAPYVIPVMNINALFEQDKA